jgi:hypothetical protein
VSGVRKKPFGICGRCGFRYKLEELRVEVVNWSETSLMVCPECWDPDQPQNHLGTLKSGDFQALKDPRPDLGQTASRWGDSVVWNFGTGVDDWRYVQASSGDANTLTWNDDNSHTVSATQTLSGIGSLQYFKKADETGSYTSIDTSDLDILRIVLMLDTGEPPAGPWVGNLYWGITTDTSIDPFDGATPLQIPEPDWNKSMGDRYITMKYDLSGEAAWTGTVTSLRIDLYNTSSFQTFKISSIRVEEN